VTSIEKKRRVAAVLAVALVTVAAYSGSLDGELVSDDLSGIQNNPLVTSLTWPNVLEIFTSFDDANYMPLKVLSLAVDHSIWGPEPFGFHLVNLVFHVGCAVLVLSILLRLGFSSFAAFLVATLWAVHPLQVESVAWISERKNVLSGLFFFAAFRVYLEVSDHPRKSTCLLTLLLFGLALLSKMNTVVLPALCIAYELVYNRRLRRNQLIVIAPMLVMGVFVVGYNLYGSPVHGDGFHGGSPWVTWLSSAVVVLRYAWHVLYPVNLTPGYDVVLYGSLFDPVVLFAVLSLVGLVFAIAVLSSRGNKNAFWLLWALITLAPMLNIVPFRSMMQDRYMYLSLLGPLALVGAGYDAIRPQWLRRALGATAIGAVVACVFLTRDQVEIWSSPFTLWARTATTIPMEAAGRGVGRAQPEKLDYLEAQLARDPEDATIRNNLGNLAYHTGAVEAALAHYEASRRLRPEEPHNLINLGRVYLDLGRLDEAEAALVRATELRPYSYSAWLYALRLHLAMRDAASAREAWNAIVRIRPDAASSSALRRDRAALKRLSAAESKHETSTSSPYPNILLISVDTLRPDRLRAYDPRAASHPAFDALAGRGKVFTRACSTASWTLPAHASLFTSLYSDLHGAVRGKSKIRPVTSFVEILHEAGYQTVGFTDAGYVSGHFGFSRGFENYDGWASEDSRLSPQSLPRDGKHHLDTRQQLFDRATTFLETRTERRPLFLFLHTYAVHDYFRQWDHGDPTGEPGPTPRALKNLRCLIGRESCSPDEWRSMAALYSARIGEVDRALGRLLQLVETKLDLEKTYIVVLSDHGEGFDHERNRIHHGGRLHRDQLHIPLIIAGPSIFAGHVDDVVSLVDVGVSLLDLVGLDDDRKTDGRSLASAVRATASLGRAEAVWAHEFFHEWRNGVRVSGQQTGGAPIQSARIDTHYWYIRDDSRIELYTTDDTNQAHPIEKLPRGFPPEPPRSFELESSTSDIRDAKLTDQLRALGYIE
jgi:arylsulfatase A-like enzyme